MSRIADAEPIVVVSGLPRSGTSLLMSMLGAAGLELLCDGVRAPDASNPNGYFELDAVKRSAHDVAWVDRAAGRAVKVIAPLLASLPRDRSYRVILMQRGTAQIVASQNAMLSRAGHESDGIPASRLEQILAAKLFEARTLLEREACFEWIALDYEELIERPRESVREVGHFLRLEGAIESMIERIDPELRHFRG